MIDAAALVGPASRCIDRLAEYRRRGAVMPVLVTHAVRGDYQSSFRKVVKVFGAVN
jgi:alkanesulfonate monooxygenase SsuD/methylene tetrahydromethanopterin reductase-like flavin-dependent oxidoreductase (luciferase family)